MNDIPEAAIEAAMKRGTFFDQRRNVKSVLEAAYPVLYKEISAAVLNDAADAIQAIHPGEVKNSVVFLRERASLYLPPKGV